MVQVNDICLKDATGMWRVVVWGSLVTLSPSMSPSRAHCFYGILVVCSRQLINNPQGSAKQNEWGSILAIVLGLLDYIRGKRGLRPVLPLSQFVGFIHGRSKNI